MSNRIKNCLWFTQSSLWHGIMVFLAMKLVLIVALDIAVYAVIFQAGSRTSVFLPITYWMQHHGLTAFRILMIRPGSSIGNACNALALFGSCAFVAWRILKYFPKNLPTRNRPLNK
ncbi:MAG: hypothetical protein ABF641_10355 [Acetobacter sp.]